MFHHGSDDPGMLPAAVPGSLGETLYLNALHFGGGTGVASSDSRLDHAALYRRGHRLAAALARRGITREHRIAILSMNTVELMEIYAASEISGIPAVPLNVRLSPAEIRRIVADCGPAIIFYEAQYAEIAATLRKGVAAVPHGVCIDAAEYEAFVADAPPHVPWAPFGDDSLAYILYTSGTTGAPKGCMHSHRSFRALGALMTAKMGLTASDRGLVMMPLFHMGGKAVQLGLHWSGGEMLIHRGFDPRLLLETIERERITVTHMAPTMIQTLLDQPALDGYDLSSLRVIFYSAAPMPEPVLRRGLERFGPVFIQSYGQTEITGTVLPARCHLLSGPGEARRHLTSVGIPPRGVSVQVVDEGGKVCPTGVPGEVLMRSPAAMTGYWNNASATAETLKEGWVRTGDVGTLDDEGFLFLVDRKKDVIISGGENIYSREVENALYAHPQILEAAVIGVPDDRWGEAVCAVIVPEPDSGLDAEAVVAHCRTLIAGYKRPRHVHFVDALPKLASGKIDKKALRASRRITSAGPSDAERDQSA